jgi:shikimate kinase
MRIALLGFMGSGKSTVGQLLAARLQLPFYDSDAEIVARLGTPIPELFRLKGEASFRDIEQDVLATFSRLPEGVLATGGGIITRETSRPLLQEWKKVFLAVEFDELLARLSDGERANRPLLTDLIEAKKLYEKRLPIYTAWADIQVSSGTPEQVVTSILGSL